MLISDEPLLSGQPLLSGHLPFPRGWPLNRGSTVITKSHVPNEGGGGGIREEGLITKTDLQTGAY